ncbi:MAG: SoxR reducing system RseC family protein [Prevotella sp.]|nr:SoxR reducing system RseC family protein [Prevotella sp.]
MSNNIKHAGIIESVESGHVRVRILQASACGACVVSSHCHASGAKEKLIDVYETPTNTRKKGDQVTVVASTKTGARAVALGFGVPFLLLLAVLFTTMGLTGSEPIAALAALASLIPYYIGLYVCKDKISGKLSFWIE